MEPIYGTFNGINMVGADGKIYLVNGNYASKSKLQEGDELKLTITDEGAFIYKQISRLDVKRIKGTAKWEGSNCFVETADRRYQILFQSATFFHLKDNDEVVILVPKDRVVSYAPIENVIKFLKDDEKELVV